MITSLREQLLRDEGCRLKIYTDSEGVPTIGIGRNLRDKGISQTEAEYLLDRDIRDAASDVIAHLPWAETLDEIRFGALVNLSFNMGIGGLLGFHEMLKALQAGHFELAAEQLLASKYHQQVGIRCERLAQQIMTGDWQ